MTGHESGLSPTPGEFLEHVQRDAFRQACTTMRLHGALPRRVWVFRYPRPEPLGSFPDAGESERFRRRLGQVAAEAAVYVRRRLRRQAGQQQQQQEGRAGGGAGACGQRGRGSPCPAGHPAPPGPAPQTPARLNGRARGREGVETRAGRRGRPGPPPPPFPVEWP
ncbi:hypothetical protein MTF65_18050 [Streptomyces sp. APSN-46.1]|uniref:hypothetical protein n=1 Tax=Streptomyces sp. APSN-46.1 TaxID=2929049 RepID=UPI001FB1B474|nr:hypothetical protein [Streptomyces sp. APSN-46.1]MCJ1679210.1 hypothetical protein [Streptomyces sp. APSN-46.1]